MSSPSAPHHVVEPGEFAALHGWLPGAYPEVWEAMEVEQVGETGGARALPLAAPLEAALLTRWTGAGSYCSWPVQVDSLHRRQASAAVP